MRRRSSSDIAAATFQPRFLRPNSSLLINPERTAAVTGSLAVGEPDYTTQQALLSDPVLIAPLNSN